MGIKSKQNRILTECRTFRGFIVFKNIAGLMRMQQAWRTDWVMKNYIRIKPDTQEWQDAYKVISRLARLEEVVAGILSLYPRHMNDELYVKSFNLTVNGQPLVFKVNKQGDAFQVVDYFKMTNDGYKAVGRIGYGGYESGRVHFASSRTIANMMERHIKSQGWEF